MARASGWQRAGCHYCGRLELPSPVIVAVVSAASCSRCWRAPASAVASGGDDGDGGARREEAPLTSGKLTS